jgi:PAS domain S-box-containing protein
LRILIEQSRDGIVILDQEGRVYQSNKQFASMIGYSPEEVSRLHVSDWEYLLPREQLEEMIRTLDAAGDHFETLHRRKDGTVYDVEISTNAAVLGDKKLIFCICRDITERKKNESVIRENQARFRELIEQAPDGIIVHDFEGTILMFNRRVAALYGYSAEEFAGMKISDINHRINIAEHKEKYWQKMQKGAAVTFEGPVYRKDGSTFYQEAIISIIEYGGRLVVLTFHRDISERKKTEEMVRESEARFREVVDQAPDGIVVHDLNGNLLTFNSRDAGMFG